VQALLDAKAQVNTKMKNGQTALDLASAGGHTKVIALLRKAGAN
jgi:ankyrin repeat protein